MKIAFYTNQLGERGTEIALYDYAYYNRALLNNESIIIYNRNHPWNHQGTINKFKKEFQVFEVSSDSNVPELDKILSDEKCDMIYMILYGTPIPVPTKVKVCIHSVFNCQIPFGDVYASVSPNVPGNNGQYPVVPHMINLPDHSRNMRSILSIPEGAIVFGRHGGRGTFNIPYVHKIIYEIARENLNIYFLFVNTALFCESLPNIIHLDIISDLEEKVEFINTCDAMIWGGADGETFGLSIGEFSTKNKPVFATVLGVTAYADILGGKGLWYKEDTLKDMLLKFNPLEYKTKDLNAYKDYTPERVMQVFKEVFIDSKVHINSKLYPITFSIPKSKIVSTIPKKTKLLSSIIPGERNTYKFNNETDYYNEYKTSMFAKTTKKSGWDCMRHYEIIANGCIPYFPDLEDCPPNTMALLPKDLLLEGNALYAKMSSSIKDKMRNSIKDNIIEYYALNIKLLTYLRENLTTRQIAKYILEKTNHTSAKKILFFSGNLHPDYLRCLTLHGFKELLGKDCHDYPKLPHIYKSDEDFTRLYGMGMTYSNLLEHDLHDKELDLNIVRDIITHTYDIVIYGSYHRGMPHYELISKIYKPNEIILLCGEDIHECTYKNILLSNGHHVFIREL